MISVSKKETNIAGAYVLDLANISESNSRLLTHSQSNSEGLLYKIQLLDSDLEVSRHQNCPARLFEKLIVFTRQFDKKKCILHDFSYKFC